MAFNIFYSIFTGRQILLRDIATRCPQQTESNMGKISDEFHAIRVYNRVFISVCVFVCLCVCVCVCVCVWASTTSAHTNIVCIHYTSKNNGPVNLKL